jgi:urease accessory protein
LDQIEGRVTLQFPITPKPVFQRARGRLSISAACDQGKVTRLKNLRQEGSYRAVFPKPKINKLEAVIINTAGGVTGGDRFSVRVVAQDNAQFSVTTQAAERIYRASANDAGQMANQLSLAKRAQLFWLPQETILFEGCRLQRSLEVDVDPSATLLVLEPLVFGRQASGEDLRCCSIQDRVSITSNGRPIYLDRINMNGDIAATLKRGAIAGGARAMASLVLVGPEAKRLLSACRGLLPHSAGASLLSDTVLVIRLLAEDSFALRSTLLPILTLLTNDAVPKNWRL